MIILAIFYFIIGICVASFSNVLIYRLPKGESINFPASHCQSCHTPLKWYHNIPLFSWVFLGGKCAFCKEEISPQYPLIELMGGIFMVLALYKEFEFSSFAFLQGDYLMLFKALMIGLLFIILLASSVVDFRYTAVPDALLNSSVIISLLYAFSLDGLKNAFIFAAIFYAIRFILSKVKKMEAMGLADIYLFACMGAVLGLNLGFFAIFLGAVLTLPFYAIVRTKDYEMPFFPFLSTGLFLVYCFDSFALKFLNFVMYG